MDSRVTALEGLLGPRFPELAADAIQRICQFYGLVLEENERQNLTRLISPQDFLDGHVADTVELWRSKLVEMPAVDLGSGAGVPGLLFSACFGGSWTLVESEKKKADFLSATITQLALPEIAAAPVRGEAYLASHHAGSVVARAVGPVERIHGWLRNCSTWNNLVLLKGPKWDAEWEEFSKGRFRRELAVEKTHAYRVRDDQGTRWIIRLVRR